MIVSLFASGSGGNCALLSQGQTHVLIDAGISLRRIRAALATHSLEVGQLAGVLITHEHTDHVAALPMLCKYHEVPLFAPRTVANHLRWAMAGVDDRLREIIPGEPFELGELRVTAFHTSHDTEESVGYRIEAADAAFGFCTDTGCVTAEMLRYLSGCGAAALEANHDEALLCDGPYPPALKRRILSPRGHLSSDCCAALAVTLAQSGTERFVLAHLSRENNRPALAYDTVRRALNEAGFTARGLDTAPVLGDLTLEVCPCCV